jgi:dienelactone hydrolase
MLIQKNQIIKGSLGIEMATDYFVPEGKNDLPVVIYTHGFNGFKDWGNFDLISEEFAKAGFLFVKYNLSHNGTNLENPEEFVDLQLYRENTYTIEYLDLSFVIDHVCSENFEHKKRISDQIYLLGHSRGGAISILGAQDKRIKGLVTWASIAACTSPWSRFSDEQMADWKAKGVFYYENKRTNQQLPIDYHIYEDYEANADEYNLVEAVSIMTKPMLFIHGEQDPAVPYEAAEKLYSANPTHAKMLLCKGDHVFGRKHPWPHDYHPTETKFVVNETIQFLKS